MLHCATLAAARWVQPFESGEYLMIFNARIAKTSRRMLVLLLLFSTLGLAITACGSSTNGGSTPPETQPPETQPPETQPPDIQPDPVSFSSTSGVPIGAEVTSNQVEISGLGPDVSISVNVIAGELLVNGALVVVPHEVRNGDLVRLRTNSPEFNGESKQVRLQLGSGTSSWGVSTEVAPFSISTTSSDMALSEWCGEGCGASFRLNAEASFLDDVSLTAENPHPDVLEFWFFEDDKVWENASGSVALKGVAKFAADPGSYGIFLIAESADYRIRRPFTVRVWNNSVGYGLWEGTLNRDDGPSATYQISPVALGDRSVSFTEITPSGPVVLTGTSEVRDSTQRLLTMQPTLGGTVTVVADFNRLTMQATGTVELSSGGTVSVSGTFDRIE